MDKLKQKVKDINQPKVQREMRQEMLKIADAVLKLKGAPGYKEYTDEIKAARSNLLQGYREVDPKNPQALMYLQAQDYLLSLFVNIIERAEAVAEQQKLQAPTGF